MTGLRLMPRLACENDTGADSQMTPVAIHGGMARDSFAAACGYTRFCPVGGDAPGSPTGMGATPQAEGLVRTRGPACFHTLAPALQGSLPYHHPSREGVSRQGASRRPWQR